jgi:pimeloyl-ACP methyl ester carboxylesterase
MTCERFAFSTEGSPLNTDRRSRASSRGAINTAVLEKHSPPPRPSVGVMETVTSADRTTIAFDQLGTGTPLVLVAGASCDRAVDAAIAEGLAGHFTVLNYDRRGRGDSTDTPPYAVEREIEDLDVLLAAAGGTATVVGLSSGGGLAAHAAASGLPISHLVLWEPPYRLDAEGQRAATEYNERLAELLADGRRGDALELFMGMVGLPPEMIAGMRQSPYWAAGEAMAPTLAYDAAVMGDGSVPGDRFAQITAPSLVLAGGASPGWFRESARGVAAAIPGAAYGELPGQTHDVAADVLAAAVRDFAGLPSVG